MGFEWLLSFLERQMQHVFSAPVPFVVALIAATLLVISFLSNHYQNKYRERLDNKDSEISLLKSRLEGAEGSAALPPGAPPSGRTLTVEQISTIRRKLSFRNDAPHKVTIEREMNCSDCPTFANELEHALKGVANLEVSNRGDFMGPPVTHSSGLIIAGAGFDDPNSDAAKLSAAFTAANVDHHQHVFEGTEDVQVWVQIKRKY